MLNNFINETKNEFSFNNAFQICAKYEKFSFRLLVYS